MGNFDHQFISLVLGLFLLFCSLLSMVAAFKGAEYADDYGFRFFWFPLLIGFTCLSLVFAHYGLASLNRRSENVRVCPCTNCPSMKLQCNWSENFTHAILTGNEKGPA